MHLQQRPVRFSLATMTRAAQSMMANLPEQHEDVNADEYFTRESFDFYMSFLNGD